MKQRKVDMLHGPITKGLLSMTIPVMIMNVMQSLFSVVDMSILGVMVDDSAVGAVGACGMLITLCTGLLIGISTGANVIVAKHIGEEDRKGANEAASTSLIFSVLGGTALLIIGVLCAEYFLKWTNCPAELIDRAIIYFRIYFCGAPVIMLYNFAASILRAAGDTKRPMYFLILSGVIKVVLNVFFIKVFNANVEGVAVATIISNAVSATLALVCVFRIDDKFHITFKNLKFDMCELREILYVGIPTGLQHALYSFANVVITTVVNSFGPDATTGIAIANQFDGILYQISCAASVAAMPYIAQNIGARNIKRMKKAVLSSIMITVSFGATFGAVSAIFSGQLSSLMSTTPAVIMYSKQKMMLISSTYFICGINEVMGGALRGMGKPIAPTIATLVFMCLFRFVWVYCIYPLCPNLTFLYLVWPVGWILSISTLLCVYFPTLSKLQKKFAYNGVFTVG